jgi:hypothetical protein
MPLLFPPEIIENSVENYYAKIDNCNFILKNTLIINL